MFVLFLCLALTAVCVLLHYETLRLLNDRLGPITIISMRAKVLAALVGALTSHVLQIGRSRSPITSCETSSGWADSAGLSRTRR